MPAQSEVVKEEWPNASRERGIDKEDLLEKVSDSQTSAFSRYADFYIGRQGAASFLRYELMSAILGPMPGSVGLLLRKFFYPQLLGSVGSDVVFGRSIAVRHPGKIVIGDRTGIDDFCLIDGSGAGDEGVFIGDDVLIARSTIIQAKTGPVRIGSSVSIGSQCQLSSVSGITVGDYAMIGGQCYIGGGRYHIEDRERPIRTQGLYSRGRVVIGEDVWIGAGARILDGVEIGKGSVIGAGAIVQENVPPFTVAAPYTRLVKMPRGGAE